MNCIPLYVLPVWVFKCLFKLPAREDANSHWLHLFDCSPVCVFRCFLKLLSWENAESHWLHLFWFFSNMCFQMCLQIARPRDFSSVFSNCFSKGMQIHIGCTFARLNYLRCSSLSLGPLHWSCSNLNHVVQDFDSSSCAANKKCCLLHESRFKLRKYLDCKFVFGLAKTLESETQQKSSIAFYATGSTLHEYLKKKNLFIKIGPVIQFWLRKWLNWIWEVWIFHPKYPYWFFDNPDELRVLSSSV